MTIAFVGMVVLLAVGGVITGSGFAAMDDSDIDEGETANGIEHITHGDTEHVAFESSLTNHTQNASEATTLNELAMLSDESPPNQNTDLFSSTTLQTAGQWPGDVGGPDNWVPYTDADGFTVRNAVTGQNLQWLRMSSGERATGVRGTLPTAQVAADDDNVFFRLRTLGSPYRFDHRSWQNQGYHQVAIGTDPDGDGTYTTQAFIGMHVNADGRVFIRNAQTGAETTIYPGNRDIDQAQGVRVVQANNGNENPAFWTDVQVPISQIQQVTGIDGDTPIRLFFGTATQSNTINTDTMGNTGSITYSDVLTSSFNSLEQDLTNAANVQIETPEDGSTITTSRPTITGTTSSGSGTLRLFVDGNLVRTIEDVGESWEYQLSESQALSEGEHRVRAELTRGGQTATTQTNTFTVDTVEPPETTTETLSDWTVDQSGYSQQLEATGGTGPYTWSIASGSLPDGLSLNSDGQITGTPNQVGTFAVTIQVSDSTGRTSTREYTTRVNDQPEITSPPLEAGAEGQSYSETMTATGGTQPYSWDIESGALPSGLSIDAETGEISGTPTETGTYTFTVGVTDSTGAVDTKEYSITVSDQLAITTRSLDEWTVGQPNYAEQLEAVGGNGGYRWSITSGSLPDGLSLGAQSGEITGTPTTAGTFTFTATVRDRGGQGTAVNQQFTIRINDEPSIPDQAISDGIEGAAYSQQLVSTGGTDPLTWELDSGDLPDGLTIDENGYISGVPSQPGTYTFTVRVTDEIGVTTTKQFTMTVGDGLTVQTDQLDGWTVDQSGYEQTVEATGGTEPYEYSITAGALPDGLTLNEATGEITGTPTQVGSFPVTITVTDADGTEVSREYSIFVSESVEITSGDVLRTGVEDVAYDETLLVEGGTQPNTWSVIGGELPPGLELDSDTGQITGTPSTAGTYAFTVQVTDTTGSTDTKTVTIEISDSLSVATASLPDWTVDVPYTALVEGVGGTEPYTFSVSDGALPDGLELDTEHGRITGTPTQTGTSDFNITIEDADGTTVTRPFSITINEPIEITTAQTLSSGVEGVGYSTRLESEGGTQPGFWRVESGELPPGVTLQENGILSGSPTASGTFEFTASVTDSAGSTADRTFTLSVTDGLVVQTDDLDAWTVDQSGYSQTLEAAGGTEPYTWRVAGGDLPDGLSLNSQTGEISGTPTHTGTFTVIVEVTDGDGSIATQELTITINDRPEITSPETLSGGVGGLTYTEALAFEGGTGELTWALVGGELPPGLELDESTGEISGTPTAAGTYTFTVQVTDETGATTTKQLAIVVGDELSMTTTTLDDWTVDQSGYAQIINVSGGTEPYDWSITDGALPNGLSLDTETGAITGTPTEAGEFEFTVRVTDADHTAVSRTYTMTINEQPQISSDTDLPGGTEDVAYSEQLTVDEGTGPFMWELAGGELPPGLTLDEDGLLSGTPTQDGTYSFFVEVTDASGATTTKQFTMTVGDGLAIETTALGSWTLDQDGYSQFVNVSGGTEPYVFAASGLPEGLTIDTETGEISGTPTQSGTFTVTIQVTDADGTSQTEVLTLTINERPELTSPADLAGAVEGVEYSEQLTFEGGTEPLSWTIPDGSLPAGLELDSNTGEITGTPTEDGEFTFTVEVTDASGASTTQTFTLVVGEQLTVTTTYPNEWTVDQPDYTQLLEARGGTLAYDWSLVDGELPAGIELDSEAGILRGTPTETGSFEFTVEVTDADGSTAQQTLTLLINDQPALEDVTVETGVEGVAYSQQLAVSEGTGPFNWEVSEGELPPGLTLDAETGKITGTPTVAGTYTFTISVTDEAGAVTTREFTTEVTDGLSIETTELADWTIDEPYSQMVTVADGTEPYSWNITAGDLPAGLTLDESTGEISGQPEETGAFAFTVTVTDADGTTISQHYTITINERPQITSPETLTGGVEGVLYHEPLTAEAGTQPITWAIIDGELPPGLDLDAETGEITGTPTDAGEYTFTVEATDASGATTTTELTILVGDRLTVTTQTLDDWTVDQPGYGQFVTAAGGTHPYEWDVSAGALPPGTNLDSETGLISGTPTQAGIYTFTVSVTDADGTTVEQELSMTVNAEPAISPAQLDRAVKGVSYSDTITVEDGTGPFTFAVSDGELPPGLELTSTGTISGTPTTAGTYVFTIEVTDETGATSTEQFTIVVGDGLTVTTGELDSWTVDQDGYSQTIDVAGGTEPYSFEITGGELPPGLELDEASGEITGTPTEAGTYTFTVRVTDSDGTTVEQELTSTINEQLQVTTASDLSSVAEGVHYSEQLSIEGGTEPVTWELTDGELPPGITIDENGLLSGTPTEAGTYTFTLTATDASGATATREFTLVVTDALAFETTDLDPWTLNQDGYSQFVNVSGGTEPYEWELVGGLPDGLTLDETTGGIAGTPTQAGTFTVTVRVTDADGTTVEREFNLTINDRPTVTAPKTLPGAVDGVSYSETITVEDGTGPLSFAVVDGELPPGLELEESSGEITGTPTAPGTYVFTVEVTDATGMTTTEQFTMVVGDGLTVTTTELDPWTVDQPAYTQTIAVAGGTEPYEYSVDGELPPGLELDQQTGEISGTPTEAGTSTFTVTVTDADGSTVEQKLSITINERPAVTTPAELAAGVEGVAYSEQLTIEGGTEPVSWAVIDGTLPPGLELASDGHISGTPTQAGEYTFTVEVTDETGATATQQVTIDVTDGLAIATGALPDWTVDQDGYSYALAATGGTEPYEWQAISGLPDGLTLNQSTGEISGTPTEFGTFSVTVQVSDADGTVRTETFELTIHEHPRFVSPTTLSGGVEDVAYSESLETTGGTEPFIWSVSDGDLPPGLALNPQTGEISGIPTEAGEYTFTVEITDASGAVTSETFTITVGDRLAVTTATLDEWTADQPNYGQTVTVAGGTEPYNWSVTEGTLPPGLALDESTGTITGTPTEAGEYTFTVTVADADGSTVEQELTITVNDEPTIETETLSAGVERVAYSEQLVASEGTGPFSWAVTDGGLPPGLELDGETGLLSGTPTASGEYTFTVTAIDASGATSEQEFTMTVTDGLTVETTSLTPWTLNQDGYSQFVEVAGGTEPYEWNVSAGALPPGLELDSSTGEISGTPTAPGTYTATVTITDADGTVVEQKLTIVINDELTISAPETLPSGVEGVTYNETVTVSDGTGPFSFAVSDGSLPPGLELDGETGLISGTPTEAGEYTFTIDVTDASGAVTTETFTITVGDGLTVATTHLAEWTIDQPHYGQMIDVAGGTELYTFTITAGALPEGLELDSNTGAITGTPTEAGTHTFTVDVTDADGTVVERELTITINEQPAITSPPTLSTGVDGVAYSQQLTLIDGTGPFTYELADGELPPGLGLDSDTGTLSGTPRAGTYVFTVEVTDASGATTAQTFTLTVGDGLTVTTTTLDSWTVDQSGYEQPINVAGGTEPYEWTVTDGELPPGLELDEASGTLTGTPTETGTFTFTIEVRDGDGTTVKQELTLTINDALSVSSPANLTAGVEGVTYTQALAVEGGTEPVTWELTAGELPPGLTLDEAGLLAGTPTQAGTYTFTVTATDASGATTTEEITITVTDGLSVETDELDSWTAGQAGYSQFVDVAGGTEPYEWHLVGDLPDGLVLNTDTGEISGTPTQSGTFTVTVEIRDADGTTLTETLTLAINERPVLTSPATLTSGVEGVAYNETVTVADGTGPFAYEIIDGELPAGLSLDAETGDISGTPEKAGTYVFTVEVTDASGATTTQTFTLTVGDGLTVTTTTLGSWTVDQSGYEQPISVAGGTEPYEWMVTDGELPPGIELDEANGTLTGTPTQSGTFTFTVQVSDGDGTATEQELSITINDGLSASSPAALAAGVEGVAYSQPLAHDGGTAPVTWEVIDGSAPPGLTLAEDGLLSGTPERAGTYTLTVQATDASGATATQEITVEITDGLDVNTGALPDWTVDQSGYTAQLEATGGTEPYQWRAVSDLPGGLELDEQTGEISGTPEQAGTFTVTVEVTDADGTTTTREIELTINEQPAIATPETLSAGTKGVFYTEMLSAEGGTGQFIWTVTDGELPPGLALNEETGQLSGLPTAAGTYTFTVEATDETGATTTREVTVSIGEGLAVETTTLDDWTVGEPGYGQTVQPVGGTEPYTWEVTDGELPAGLTLDPASGAITGTPTEAGTYTFTVQVSDGDGTTSEQELSVTINDQPTIETVEPETVASGVSYSQQLTVSDGTGPFAWEHVSGELPPGLTLDRQTGLISGIPTVAGEYTFTVEVTDASGATTRQELTITVGERLTVEMTDLDPWTVDQDGYSQMLEATGGTEPYTWQVSRGSLPDGLTLDASTGEITGTPTQSGTFEMTVQATDADGTTATRQVQLTVNPQLQTTSPAQLRGGVAGVDYSEQLTHQGGTAPFTYEVADGELPPGLELDQSSGEITGTPIEAGTFTVTVQVTDASGKTVSQEHTITISDGLAVTTQTLPEWSSGQEGYGATLQAAGGTAPYTWTVSDGQLPPGLTLDSQTGTITGTPTESGTFTFTVRATDSDGSTATQELSIQINDTLSITTTELPDGEQDESYSQQLASEGGTVPVTWDIVAGSLPPGLTLDASGTISGTPTQAGTYSFTVRASDRTGLMTVRDLQITVEDPTPPAPPDEPIPVDVPPETVDPDIGLTGPVSDVGGIELVDARLETEPTNSIRATSIVTLRNNGTETKNVTVEHRLQGEVFQAQQATLAPGQQSEFRTSRTLREPGSYRFSFTYVTEDRDRVLTRTFDTDIGTIDIDDTDVEEPTDPDEVATCELFGYSFGAYGLCWYWWVLIDGLIAAMMSYLVQTRIGGVQPVFRTSAAGRHLERASHMLPRLLVPWVVGALLALGVGIVLFTAVSPLVQFLVMAAGCGVLGIVLGYLRIPDLAEPTTSSQSE